MRAALYIVMFWVAIAGFAEAAPRNVATIAVGKIFIVSNDENPSTGFSWSLDAKRSAGLDLVKIDDLGLQPLAGDPAGLVGAPGQHGWILHALSAGRVRAVFVYGRPWERAPVKSQIVNLRITPR
jgi:inhibitor of cysteine peptidase